MGTTLPIEKCDVFIAGTGPIGATFAREILDSKNHPNAKVWMADIGAQDNPVIGAHHKNSVKYQKDIDSFVHVIQGALQPISVPPQDSYMATLGEIGWAPPPGKHLVQSYHNPNQEAHNNLKSFITRTVGGMATHWTCACPDPHAEEMKDSPIKEELPGLLKEAGGLLNVKLNEFDKSIRHNVVKNALKTHYKPGADGKERVQNLPLAVERNTAPNDTDFVTWSGVDTVLGGVHERSGFKLLTETRVTRVVYDPQAPKTIKYAEVRDLKTRRDYYIEAKQFVIACGAVGTPQVLFNSKIRPPALGKYLCEQSLTFCQIVLKRSIINTIPQLFPKESGEHCDKNKNDLLPIPWNDPEPQVTMPYSENTPWHVQIHRDAFAYGGVGPRADPRVVVDLRFFGRQEVVPSNCVEFAETDTKSNVEANKDGYGMPQATFKVVRNERDAERDHRMMAEMCTAASVLGAYLPGSEPQFMEPGLVLHITGTTRVGTDEATSVADVNSKVHGINNLYVGGNNVIPDSTACNPTKTSVAYALKAARHMCANLTL